MATKKAKKKASNKKATMTETTAAPIVQLVAPAVITREEALRTAHHRHPRT